MKTKRDITKLLAVITAIFLATCATTGSGTGGLSLMDAIEESAERIAAQLPAGSRVAIVAFESENDGLSGYIMDELTGELFDRSIEVADRQNLEFVFKELDFNMSGYVSDESAQSIGKFLAAQLVITGQLIDQGGSFRFRTNAINVETATPASIIRLDVRNDAAMRRTALALANQKTATKTAKYMVSKDVTPQSAGTFLDRGILLATQGDFEGAIRDFTEAIKLDSNMASAYALRGRASFASVSRVTGIGDNFSGVDVITNRQQITAEQARVLEQAIADFTQAIKFDPDNARFNMERGNVYANKGDYELAIADFNQAIRLDPNYAPAYNNRGILHSSRNNLDEAIADYDQAIRLDPNLVIAYYNRGVAYANRGDLDRAIADYTQAIRLDPSFAAAYYNRGLEYYNRGNIDEAIADYNQAIRLDPNYSEAYNNRGVAYANRGDLDRAIADFEATLQINPNDANARHNLEAAQQQRGR